MRVLITTSTFPITDDDGLPRFVYDLARAMAEFCQVTVLAPHHAGARHREIMGRMTVRRFQYAWPPRMQRLAYGSGMRQNWKAFRPIGLQVPGYMAALAVAVSRLSRRGRFDVVNSHWLVPQALGAALVSGRRRSWAHVVTVHAGDVSLLEKVPAAKWITSFVAARTDLFLPVSHHVGDRLQGLAGKRVPKAIQPMGVDFRRFSAPQVGPPARLPFDGRFILFVGRLVEIKGVSCLLEAMSRLASEFPTLGLVLIGSGALESDLKVKANVLGIASRTRFLGRRGHAEVVSYMHACRVLAVPSMVLAKGESEGMPTVVAEAMAAGCRVVACRTAGIPDLVEDGMNGWLARPNDPLDLACKLRQALCSQDDQVERRARQSVRCLDWPQVAENYLRHFESVLVRSRKRDE